MRGFGCLWVQRTYSQARPECGGSKSPRLEQGHGQWLWVYLCGAFEAVQVLLWGLEALTWQQTGPRCASLNLEDLRTLEVASECLASCVHRPGAPDGH